MPEPASFEPQAIRCPAFSPAEVQALVVQHYGFAPVDVRALASFQDQNFRVADAAGRLFVFKIANLSQARDDLDLQNQVLQHLAARDSSFPAPRIVVNTSGQAITPAERAGQRHWARLLTYLPGQTLADAPHLPPGLLDQLGAAAGRLSALLAGFEHPASGRSLQWDLRNAPAVTAAYLPDVREPRQAALVKDLLARCQAEAAPLLPALRTSVVHGDIVDYNILVGAGPDGQRQFRGLIDFGDVVRSFTAGELAVLLATVMAHQPQAPLEAAARTLAACHAAFPLTEAELAALFPLIGLRLCATTTSAAHQAALEPDNPYVQEFAGAEWRALELVAGISSVLALAFFRQACGLEPHPRSAAVQAWLRGHQPELAGLLTRDLSAGPLTVLDLSVASDELPAGVWDRPAAFRDYINRRMAERGGDVVVGRHAEARLNHTRYDSPAEPAAIHLGVELFLPAETAIFAPLDGEVVQWGWNTLVVRHSPEPDLAFYTRYAGLSPAEVLGLGARVQRGQMLGRLAPAEAGAPLPAHLHFQLACDWPGDLPGLAAGSAAPVWLSVCPDPNLVLRLPGLAPARDLPDRDSLTARRRRVLAQSQETYYRRPMQIVRGWRQYLIDDAGRAYLDAINNVAQVGHSHPRVSAAAARQMARLNTNNRFVYANLVELGERLQALLPEPLRVVFVVNSGSEANDLALRLARTYTGSEHILTIDGAYHGNTIASYEISTSLLDNPSAAKDVRPYIHPLIQPNTYRGPYGADDPDAGARYAADAERVLAGLAARGERPAGFIAECLLGAPGGMLPPAGYFPRVYAAVRAAGGVCIADEVQVGLGRIGTHRWAFEMQAVAPDIVTMGKPLGNGFPLSAVVTTPEIAEAFRQRYTYFNTFGGNPVACAAGLAVLDVMRDEGLQDNAREVGAYFKAQLDALIGRHPWVGAVYGHGLYLGVDLVSDRGQKTPAPGAALAVCERLRDYGIIVYPTGDYYNILKIKPPLVFSRANADFFAAQLDRVLAEGW